MKRMLADIWDGLRFQFGRTALSMLAVCVGMTALTVLLAVIGGLSQKSKAIIRDIGANVFLILPAEDGSSTLTLDSCSVLRKSLPDCRTGAVRLFTFNAGTPAIPMRIFAADENYFEIHKWELAHGRVPDRLDHANASRAALITASLADSAGWQVDSTVNIMNFPFTIAGIIENPAAAPEKDGSGAAYAPDQSTIFIPLVCAEAWMKDRDIKRRRIDMAAVQVQDPARMEASIMAAKRILSSPTAKSGYVWITPESILRNIRSLQKTVALTAGSVVLLCLVLGGTTLMSLMTANVRERVREIALRRTLGATTRDIAALFIAEACIVTLSASAAGLVTAIILIKTGNNYIDLPSALDFKTMTVPLLISLALGAAFSYLPVRLATAITPAEALRND